jgi:hypothetical protein
MQVFGINILAVLAAAVVQWILGYLWFGVLFNKDYKALTQKEGAAKPNTAGIFALTFVANFILAFALVKIVVLTGWATWARGSLVGAICGCGFVVPALFAQHVSESKPFKLFGINALYWLIAMYLSGGILAIWH